MVQLTKVTIPDGYHEIPAGRIASVVTYLEMIEPPARLDAHPPAGVALRHVEKPPADWYRRLYRAVGEPWLWFSRAVLDDRDLGAILGDPRVEVFSLDAAGEAQGLLELDLRKFPEIELAFFGLTAEWIGKGAGRFLIEHGIRQAFRYRPRRFFLHTCTLDHPSALQFYIKAGFRPYKRAIEVAPDPRETGDVRREAAPQIPIIEGNSER